MKLLFDANLSYRLIKKVRHLFPDSIHVSRTGLVIPAQDNEIWNWAKRNDYTIVTNDQDFLFYVQRFGYPPKIILIQTGNCTTNQLSELLITHFEDILHFHTDTSTGILEIV